METAASALGAPARVVVAAPEPTSAAAFGVEAGPWIRRRGALEQVHHLPAREALLALMDGGDDAVAGEPAVEEEGHPVVERGDRVTAGGERTDTHLYLLAWHRYGLARSRRMALGELVPSLS